MMPKNMIISKLIILIPAERSGLLHLYLDASPVELQKLMPHEFSTTTRRKIREVKKRTRRREGGRKHGISRMSDYL